MRECTFYEWAGYSIAARLHFSQLHICRFFAVLEKMFCTQGCTSISREAQKKRKLISQLPLENRLIFKGFGLLEVALQQTLEGAAVTGFVAGHF